jgi:hypothetical protein
METRRSSVDPYASQTPADGVSPDYPRKVCEAKSQKVEFLQLQMLAVIQNKASGADECPWR